MFTASSCQNSHQCWDPSNFQERNHVGDWGTQEEKAFANAKICQRLVLVHFISKWPLLLECDVFEIGIRALLAYTRWYKTPNWLCFKIIVTSRMQPYSQLKKRSYQFYFNGQWQLFVFCSDTAFFYTQITSFCLHC